MVDAVITIPELSGEFESHDEDDNNREGQSNKILVPALYIEFAYTSNDWPAGQEYEVSFAPEVFESKDKLTDDKFSFITRPLQGRIEMSEFGLSVKDKLKQVYVELVFEKTSAWHFQREVSDTFKSL